MSVTRIDFVHTVNGVATNANAVVLSDPTGTFGLQRKDNSSIVVPANTPLIRAGTGIYYYEFTDPAPDLTYRYYLRIEYGTLVTYRERETSLTPNEQLEIAGRYASYAGMRAKFGGTSLRKWAAVDGTENHSQIVETITAAIQSADTYVDDFLLGCPYDIPFVTAIPPTIRECANVLAGVLLYEAQGIVDSEAGQEAQGRFKVNRQMAMRTLARIKGGFISLTDATGNAISRGSAVPEAGIEPCCNGYLNINGQQVCIPCDLPPNLLKYY